MFHFIPYGSRISYFTEIYGRSKLTQNSHGRLTSQFSI